MAKVIECYIRFEEKIVVGEPRLNPTVSNYSMEVLKALNIAGLRDEVVRFRVEEVKSV